MNIIPALEMKGRRTSASDCTGKQIVVKYEFVSSESFKCRVCNRRMQRRGSRQLTVVDTPYMQYDIELQIETPCLFCPHCSKYAVVRPQCIHPKRCMTFRLMGYIARLPRQDCFPSFYACLKAVFYEQIRTSSPSRMKSARFAWTAGEP